MKYSKQRELIRQTVIDYPHHPTADKVFELVRNQLPSISLGTVYRNLRLLSQLGQLKTIHLPNGSDRFDSRLDEHYHMICVQCGQVFDIELDALDGLDRTIYEKTGFAVASHLLFIEGLCKDCQK